MSARPGNIKAYYPSLGLSGAQGDTLRRDLRVFMEEKQGLSRKEICERTDTEIREDAYRFLDDKGACTWPKIGEFAYPRDRIKFQPLIAQMLMIQRKNKQLRFPKPSTRTGSMSMSISDISDSSEDEYDIEQGNNHGKSRVESNYATRSKPFEPVQPTNGIQQKEVTGSYSRDQLSPSRAVTRREAEARDSLTAAADTLGSSRPATNKRVAAEGPGDDDTLQSNKRTVSATGTGKIQQRGDNQATRSISSPSTADMAGIAQEGLRRIPDGSNGTATEGSTSEATLVAKCEAKAAKTAPTPETPSTPPIPPIRMSLLRGVSPERLLVGVKYLSDKLAQIEQHTEINMKSAPEEPVAQVSFLKALLASYGEMSKRARNFVEAHSYGDPE